MIVDDHKIVVEGLSALLSETPDIEISGKFYNAENALRFLNTNEAHVVITDINLPGINGILFCQKATAVFKELKFIALTMYEDAEVLSACREAGFSGYIRKECTTDEILETLDAVIDGEKRFTLPYKIKSNRKGTTTR